MLRVRRRFLGQFPANEQTERVLQVLGPVTLDIKHAVIDNPGYPHWPLVLTLPIKTVLHSNVWLTMKWMFHHNALLLTFV